MILVLSVLPTFLVIFDKAIEVTTFSNLKNTFINLKDNLKKKKLNDHNSLTE